jgi:AcrR family transcriptional regulator
VVPRDTLTREQIVQVAIELLDAEGLDGLSMRQLGARLGSAATAVYWHVGSKDNLVVLAADEVWVEVGLPDLTVVDWRTAASAMAHGLYDMIIRHPWLMPAMSTHLMYGPGKARHDDHLLGVYETAGFSPPDAARAAHVVVTFVLGTALGVTADSAWQARMRRAGKADRIDELAGRATGIAARFPRLRAFAEAPDVGHGLDFGLRTVLDGLAERLAAPA